MLDAFVHPALAESVVSVSILTFCLSTQIGFFVYYETAAIQVFGKKSMKFLKWIYLMPGIFFAGMANVDELWVFADISVGVCALPNLVALLALNGVFFRLMKDYLGGQNEFSTKVVDSSKKYARLAKRKKQ